MKAGKFETGCPAIAESYRLDPKAGALFTLAECEAGWGKSASALRDYGRYLGLFEAMPDDQKARQRERAEIARAQQKLLASKVARVTLVLAPGAPAGTVVRRDGAPVEAADLGAEVPMDPGPIDLVVDAPGRPSRTVRVVVAAGEERRIDLAPGDAPVPADKPREASSGIPRRTWVYVAGGVGLVGLGLGAVTGAMALGKKSTIDEHCIDLVCDDEGADAAEASKPLGLLSTIGFAVGVAGAGAAIVLWVTEPKEPEAQRVGLGFSASPDQARATIRGTW
jgi:hypothetical protein